MPMWWAKAHRGGTVNGLARNLKGPRKEMSCLHRPWKINGFWSQQSGGPLESRWFSLAPLVGTPWFKHGMVDVMQSYDVWSLPNATTFFWSARSGTFSHKKATRKVPNLYILLVMARSRSKSLRCVKCVQVDVDVFYKCYCPTMDGYRWNHSWKSQKLAGNGRAVVVASDIFGIHTGRHKEICDSIAEEVTDRVGVRGKGLYSQDQCTINEMEHISSHRHAMIM